MVSSTRTRPFRPATRGVLADLREGRRRRRATRVERRRASGERAERLRAARERETGPTGGDLLAAMHAGDDVTVRALRTVAHQVERDRGTA